jgi:hypothetical protein
MANYTYTSPVTGTSGQVLMSNGTSIPINHNTTNSITWGTTSVNTSPWVTIGDSSTPSSLSVKGDAKFEHDVEILGDLKIKNKSLSESLKNIEERLSILHPNEELESRWEDLRRLRKEYMAIEAELIEKEKMWAILKK